MCSASTRITTRTGTATIMPRTDHSHAQSATVRNTTTVLSCNRRETKNGVINCPSNEVSARKVSPTISGVNRSS